MGGNLSKYSYSLLKLEQTEILKGTVIIIMSTIVSKVIIAAILLLHVIRMKFYLNRIIKLLQ